MKRDEVLAIVAAHREQLEALVVKSLNRDVDFLVEFDRSQFI